MYPFVFALLWNWPFCLFFLSSRFYFPWSFAFLYIAEAAIARASYVGIDGVVFCTRYILYISISIYKASAMLHLCTSAPCIASIVSTFYSLDEFFTELK